MKVALENKCTKAILKTKSPSCGCGKIYDGTFTEKLIDGDGVFCRLLKKTTIKIHTEEELQTNIKTRLSNNP